MKRIAATDLRRAANAHAWAVGHQVRNGFHVRRVVWGLLMARMERQPHEEIRAAVINVGPKRQGPKNKDDLIGELIP